MVMMQKLWKPSFFDPFEYDSINAMAHSVGKVLKEFDAKRCSFNDTRCYSRSNLLKALKDYKDPDGISGK